MFTRRLGNWTRSGMASTRSVWRFVNSKLIRRYSRITSSSFSVESFFPHFIAFLVAIGSTVVSFLAFGLLIRRRPQWRGMGNTLLIASPLTLVLLIVAQMTFDPIAAGANIGVAGLTQRVAVTEVFLWFLALAWVARRSSDRAQRAALRIAA